MKSARRSRTKIRKPKFLSLRVVLSPENSQRSTPMSPGDHDFSDCQDHQQQLNLFPLHPENLIEDKEIHEENVAFILNTASSDSSLHGLLPTAGDSTSSEEEALSFAYRGSYSSGNENSCSLLRSAMRSRERDASDEKWVSYSEVVEWKEVEEVSSCAADQRRKKGVRGLLSLKLDYEGILNAWSDQAPLFIKGEFPQTVPDLQDDHHILQLDPFAIGLVDGWRSSGNVWKVPEMEGSLKMEGEKGGKESWKTAQREASVLRYKEKRQSRLFAKRIRYEVRKLNAEKRPRLKGRFVKRD